MHQMGLPDYEGLVRWLSREAASLSALPRARADEGKHLFPEVVLRLPPVHTHPQNKCGKMKTMGG